MPNIVIDPVTRIEGHLRIEVQAENGRIADAWAVTTPGFAEVDVVVVENRFAVRIRKIFGAQAPSHLSAGGWLLLEHGWMQAETVRNLMQRAGFNAVHSRRDLAGIERCTGGQWCGAARPG